MSRTAKISYYFLSSKQDSFHGFPYCCAVATKYTKRLQTLSLSVFNVRERLYDSSVLIPLLLR